MMRLRLSSSFRVDANASNSGSNGFVGSCSSSRRSTNSSAVSSSDGWRFALALVLAFRRVIARANGAVFILLVLACAW